MPSQDIRGVCQVGDEDALRQDFVAEDLIILLMASAGVVAATGKAVPRAAPRLIGYLLQAFAAPAGGPLPPPPSSRQIYKAITRLHDATDGFVLHDGKDSGSVLCGGRDTRPAHGPAPLT